jgi:signal transduction histidine kinase
MKAVVAMQQDLAKGEGVLEEVKPEDLLEDAVQLNGGTLEQQSVQVVREYQAVPKIFVDRHKAVQILADLVNNASHALRDVSSNRILKLCLGADGPDRVQFRVGDNGVGIAGENLNRIFSQGFTTRKDGHGFGLHSGANFAKELGGSLSVHSDGLGKGAVFTLVIPARTKE